MSLFFRYKYICSGVCIFTTDISGTKDIGTSQAKRAKTDDNTMETTSSVSEENYTGGASGNPQLTEIIAKLSLLLTAVNEQTALLREVIGSRSMLNNDELVKTIGTVIQSIESEMKFKANTGQQAAGAHSFEKVAENVMEAEAMRIKSSIGATWEQKLNARKDAYWAKTRNEGYLVVHQKWIQEGTPLIIPKKLQKPEIRNENDNQRQLRERVVMQETK